MVARRHPVNISQQDQTLARKQIAVQEGIELLRQAQQEFGRHRASADAWGATAVVANVALIPLNVIVNAFELKAAQNAYQFLVQQVYGKLAKSGTRSEGHAKTALALLKQAIVGELKRQALTQYVPGVNILVGLAEDTLAAWQAIQRVEGGSREFAQQAAALDRVINAAIQQMLKIGVQRAELLARMQLQARTA
jgi:hypothetical protein